MTAGTPTAPRPSLALRAVVVLVNAVARLAEHAVMRFPNRTDTKDFR